MEQSNSHSTECRASGIAVQMPLHSLTEDITTVKRAIDHIGGPVTLVGYSYGGLVTTNAAYNNPNVKDLSTLPPLLLMKVKLAMISSESSRGIFEDVP